jgi:predicted aldo/keto reductase-like oxidoreductase
MRYRPLGPKGVMISELSFGCGHLPDDDEESTRVIHAAIENGINYFETASFYCNGRCQEKTGLGVKGFADKVMVSAKIGVGPETTADTYRKELERQLSVLGLDKVTWLQVGWLSVENLPFLTQKGGALEAIEKALDEGLIKHLGFTGHDSPENFIQILRTGLFESMTVSYHLLNRAYEPTIAVAQELGIGVVAMNPVGGGILGKPSTQLQKLLPDGAVTSTAGIALRFVLANPGITTACSGMHTIANVEENVNAVAEIKEQTIAEHLRQLEILDQFKSLGDKFCTGCRYCMPCQHGVNIPQCFNLYNLANVYGLQEVACGQYNGMKEEERADKCTECGECEIKCPNALPIIKQLQKVTALFG